jgi:hypothetical protein
LAARFHTTKTHNGSGAADIAAPHAICTQEELICETDVSLGEDKPRPTDARPDAKTVHFETLGLFSPDQTCFRAALNV